MTEGKNNSIQLSFLKKLETIIPANTSFAGEIADILDISADSAYRRLRGETALSIDEVVKLCNHFKISFDSFNNPETGLVSFKYNLIESDEKSFKIYLESIFRELKIINSSPEKQIIYACEDIPIFHNFNYPELASFKIFYWMRSIMNVPELQKEYVDISIVSDELRNLGKQVFNLYASIPSIEIWTETTINSTLKQIEFYYDSGVFKNKEDALKICDVLRTLLDDIKKQAENGHKLNDQKKIPGPENSYTVYFSEIEITNNCVLVNMGDIKAVFLGHFTFNTMSTTNVTYCYETEKWLNAIIKKSTLISGISEKHRYQFFKKTLQNLDKLVDKIKND